MKKNAFFWDHISAQERLEAIQQIPLNPMPYQVTFILDERFWGGMVLMLFLGLGVLW